MNILALLYITNPSLPKFVAFILECLKFYICPNTKCKKWTDGQTTVYQTCHVNVCIKIRGVGGFVLDRLFIFVN